MLAIKARKTQDGRAAPNKQAAELASSPLQARAASALEAMLALIEERIGAGQQPPHSSLLRCLLCACTTAVTVIAEMTTSPAAGGGGGWAPAESLLPQLQAALARCGDMLSESCKSRDGVTSEEQQSLQQLVDALHRYRAAMSEDQLSPSLLR